MLKQNKALTYLLRFIATLTSLFTIFVGYFGWGIDHIDRSDWHYFHLTDIMMYLIAFLLLVAVIWMWFPKKWKPQKAVNVAALLSVVLALGWLAFMWPHLMVPIVICFTGFVLAYTAKTQ